MVEINEDHLDENNGGYAELATKQGESATVTCTWEAQRQAEGWKSCTVGRDERTSGVL